MTEWERERDREGEKGFGGGSGMGVGIGGDLFESLVGRDERGEWRMEGGVAGCGREGCGI